jgi:hypothetical protein
MLYRQFKELPIDWFDIFYHQEGKMKKLSELEKDTEGVISTVNGDFLCV